jgi:hypothetical protein
MRCILLKPILAICIALAVSACSIAGALQEKEATQRANLVPKTEVAKVQVTRLDSPVNSHHQVARNSGGQKEADNSPAESGQTPYGTVLATFVLMVAIAIRRHRSGRS